MEIIPQEPNFEETIQNYSDQMSEFLSEAATGLRTINKVPKNGYKRERFLNAMHEAFEVIGGVPRLAIWADRNPDEFYKLFGKSLPSLMQQINNNINVPVTIVSALNRSVLDDEIIDVTPEKTDESEKVTDGGAAGRESANEGGNL